MTTRRSFLAATTAAALTQARAAQAQPQPTLGAATLPYRGQPLPRALEGIRRAGYRHILPFDRHQNAPAFTPALTPTERRTLRSQFADAGLTPNLAFAGLTMKAADPTTLDIFLKELDLAAEFQIPTVVSIGPGNFAKFPRIPKPRADWQRECAQFYPLLEKAVRHAATLGIVIALKPHTGITATAKDCLNVLQRLPAPNLKICWDAGNVSFYEGIGPDPDLPELLPHLRVVTLKDHRGLRANPDFPVPGTGDIDHPALFRLLAQGGFRGPFYVERVDGTEDAARMDPAIIDQRLTQARQLLTPMIETAYREKHS